MSGQVLTAQLYSALRHKYDSGQYFYFEEFTVPAIKGNGYYERRVDVVLISKTPRNRRIAVFEVKSSRQDYMNEINDATKRQASEQISTESWFVMPVGLVKPDEIPEGYGLLEIQKDLRCKTTKIPTQRSLPEWPWPVTLEFVKKGYSTPIAEKLSAGYIDQGPRKIFWKKAGQELSEKDLSELVDVIYKTRLLQIENQNQKVHIEDWKKNSNEYKSLVELRDTVALLVKNLRLQISGWYGMSLSQKLKAWTDILLKGRQPPSYQLEALLRQADKLSELATEVRKEIGDKE